MPIEFTRDNESFTTSERLPVLPLRDLVLFPYVVIPLLVGRQASLAAVEAAVNADKHLFLVAQKSGEIQEPGADDLYRVGVIARVLQVARVPNGTTKVLGEGIARGRVKRFGRPGKRLHATIEPFPVTQGERAADGQAARRRALTLFEEYVALHRRIPGEVVAMVQAADSEQRQAFGIAAHVSLKHEVRQQLLEIDSLPGIFDRLGDILSSETELLNLERKIDDDVRGAMVQNQREFYLQEQLRAIHRELGEDESDDFSDLEAQMREKSLPDAVQTRAFRELRKLRRMSPMSPEYTVARNFVDWIVSLPWNERTDDVLDVAHARQTLDADHYGLDEVKDRIIDFIAVLSLVGRIEGPILCLVGPPGVGKTSLGKSIARALGRKFVRMSLGGIRDEAEIRGHRRTYIGSMPGRIIQAMRRAEVVNPVILLDEIDKLGADFRGDPAAALLEVLDPEQNRAFNDHYLEVDYDLSQVLFVTTANSLQGIPDPLRDRMEIIRLAGYLDHEKLAIARQFLVPRQLQTNGLDPAEVSWDPDVLPEIMRNYTREAGVREFERRIARVGRKLARRIADNPGHDPGSRHSHVRHQRAARNAAARSRRRLARGQDRRGAGTRVYAERRRAARGGGQLGTGARQAAAHGHTRRRHEGVGDRGAELHALPRGRARHSTGFLPDPRHPRPPAGRRDTQGRPVRRNRDRDRRDQRAGADPGARRRRDDG